MRGHAAGSSLLSSGGGAYRVRGTDIGRDSLLIGAGVSIKFASPVTGYLSYDGELFRSQYSSHRISTGVRMEF